MSKPLSVGVIGCGAIAQMMHLPTLAERPDLFRIAGLADIDRDTLDAVADRYHVARRTTHFHELVNSSEVEAILVLASGLHGPFVHAALESGKHVFVEKPLGFSLAETQQIAEVCSRSGRIVQVGYHKRFDPAVLRAADIIGTMSDLRLVEVTVLHPDEDAYRKHHALVPVRARTPLSEEQLDALALREAAAEPVASALAETLGANAPADARLALFVLLTSLIHDINLVRALVGEPEQVHSAHTWRGGMAQTSVTQFAGDVRVVMTWISVPGVAHYEEQVRFIGSTRRAILTFPSPYLRHAPTALEVERMDDETVVFERHRVSYEEAFRAELHHFHAAVRQGQPAQPGIADALADARWIDAIAHALLRGTPASIGVHSVPTG